jgi:hypothetical protein
MRVFWLVSFLYIANAWISNNATNTISAQENLIRKEL